MHAIWPAVFLAMALGIPLCGGEGEGDCDCFKHGGVASAITGNHDHDLGVPAENFSSPADHAYSIRGEADHDHQVSYTGTQLEVVSRSNSATVTSTAAAGHTHDVTLDCSCF